MRIKCIGSRGSSFKRPLLSVDVPVSLCVCLSATLMLNISETKPFRPIWQQYLQESKLSLGYDLPHVVTADCLVGLISDCCQISAVFEILGSKRIGVTTWPFKVTWPFNSPQAISYWWFFGTKHLYSGFRDIQWWMWHNDWHDLKRPLMCLWQLFSASQRCFALEFLRLLSVFLHSSHTNFTSSDSA